MVKKHTTDATDQDTGLIAVAALSQTDDLITDALRVCMALAPAFGEAVARQADAILRERWGGDRVYIARREGDGRSSRNAAIIRDYLAGERLGLLERRYGLTQRRLLQIIKAPDEKPGR